jgi:DNA replication and repair protein RecF
LEYESSIKDLSYKTVLTASLARDRAVHHTTVGPHRDDLDFKLMGNSLKKFASQGQQKSYLLALKLAQFEFIKEKKHTKPLLLLDDIYDKLDETRFKKLIELVSGDEFGQVFITDTHPGRIQELFEQNNSEHIIYKVNNGIIHKHG